MTPDETIEDVLDLDLSTAGDDRQWVILYDEDYDGLMIDQTDQVALLLDARQAFELFRLSTMALESLTDIDTGVDLEGVDFDAE